MDVKHLAVALEAALSAGDYFKSRVGGEMTVKTKSSPSDLVTDVDPFCERMIRERIHRDFPHHSFLGEESTAPGAEASTRATKDASAAEELWVVDPIDGTTNFVYGVPLSVVSIAFAHNGRVVLGVVYDPYREEVFYGLSGHGAYAASASSIRAWLIQPSSDFVGILMKASKEVDLHRSVVASGFPSRAPYPEEATLAGLRLSVQLKSLRAFGTAALHLAYVAVGRLDGFWEYDLNAWDLAAGVFLIEESHGFAKELGAGDYHLNVRHVVAAGTQCLALDIERIVNVLK